MATVENTIYPVFYNVREIERAIVAAWSDSEDREFWLLQQAKFATEISPAGAVEWQRLADRQAAIYRSVETRAMARLNKEASCLALAA